MGRYNDEQNNQWQKGYDAQWEFLQGKTLEEARQTLDARLATSEGTALNHGSHAACRHYIKTLKAAQIDSSDPS